MIVLGNEEFALGLRFAGVRESHVIKSREEGLEILKRVPRNEFIIVNAGILELIPELEDFENVVSVPDSAKEFGSIDDLKQIIKSVVGIELEVV